MFFWSMNLLVTKSEKDSQVCKQSISQKAYGEDFYMRPGNKDVWMSTLKVPFPKYWLAFGSITCHKSRSLVVNVSSPLGPRLLLYAFVCFCMLLWHGGWCSLEQKRLTGLRCRCFVSLALKWLSIKKTWGISVWNTWEFQLSKARQMKSRVWHW